MSTYTDNSYPPIGPTLKYKRGDGALVTLTIEPAPTNGVKVAASPTKTIAPPIVATTRLLDLFDESPPPITEPAPQTNGHQRVRKVLQLPPEIAARLAKNVKLEGRNNGNKVAAVAPASRMPGPLAIDPGVYDHPDVGGKFTIFALLYGGTEYYDLHQRCLNSIVGSVPEGRCELRIGSNELNPQSVKLVDELIERGIVTKHYRHPENARKYPVMREMFYDPELPITTKWVVWFDDDSIADRTPSWLAVLAQMIGQFHRGDNAHMFGAKFVWTLQSGQADWIRSRSWYHQKPFRLNNGKAAPNGNRILFCTGGFWALTHEALVACDIPDPELGHNGGDYMIGEQLYQGGFNIKSFNGNKQFVHTSSVKRRGVTDPHPGTQKLVHLT